MDPIARCFNKQCTACQSSEILLKLSGKTKHWYSEKTHHNSVMDWYCRQFLLNFSPISHCPLTVKSQRKQNRIKMYTFISLLNFQHTKLQIRVHIVNATYTLNALGFFKRCVSLHWQHSYTCYTIYGYSEPYHSFF